jgi:cytoskeletal protein CcmA (bactofilin family)
MSRPPFPAAPSPAPQQGQAPGQGQGQQGMGQPAQRPGPQPARVPVERRTLVVGRGISVQGVIQDAERLVVEGIVEATNIHATELSIAPGGMFRGEVEVEDAEVAGTIDGTLTARGNLSVRATGKVLGTARCRRLQVEDGGQITGQIEMITEARAAEPVATRVQADAAG